MFEQNQNILNRHIIVAVTIAFVISFTTLFLMHFASQDPRTVQDIGTNSFFSSTLDSKKLSIFLIGHSHVGQLNTTKINQIISENYDNVDVYNLARYHDVPSKRLENINEIIALQPKIIFYGIAIADFLGPCRYSHDCNPNKKIEFELPNQKKYLENLNIPEKLGIQNMNPKFTTLQVIRTIFSENILFPEEGRRLDLGQNTPFYQIDDHYTRIVEDSFLKKSLKVSSVDLFKGSTIQNENESESLEKIIRKFQDNDIKIVLFKTPHHDYYIKNIPEKEIEYYNNVLNEISDKSNIHIYDFFDKYADLKIWNDLEHIAYNEKSSIFTEDVTKMIITEIEE